MAVLKKIAGLVVGASAVAVVGIAVAQGVPPNPFISNPALAAGQLSTHMTAMGETGVQPRIGQVQTATIYTAPQVAVVEPAPVAVAPAPVVEERQQMGAAPAAPVEEAPKVVRRARHDRG